MSSTGETGGSWQDSAAELMEGWDPASENGSLLRPPSKPATAIPSGLEAADSYPAGPTMLFRAFDPAAPGVGRRLQGPPGPVSGDCELGLAPDDGSRAAGRKSRETGRAVGPGWPRSGERHRRLPAASGTGPRRLRPGFTWPRRELGRRLVRAQGLVPGVVVPRVLDGFNTHTSFRSTRFWMSPATGLRLLCMPFFGGANLTVAPGSVGADPYPGHRPQPGGCARQFSQRLPLAAGQDVSQARGCREEDPAARLPSEPGLGRAE